jgi:hypothetical protein
VVYSRTSRIMTDVFCRNYSTWSWSQDSNGWFVLFLVRAPVPVSNVLRSTFGSDEFLLLPPRNRSRTRMAPKRSLSPRSTQLAFRPMR